MPHDGPGLQGFLPQEQQEMPQLSKWIGWLGMTAGGYAGWALGAQIGGMTAAVIVSMIGTGFGLYVGRRIVNQYF
jgi:4-hydroxybenzoate polyprenyltransferase